MQLLPNTFCNKASPGAGTVCTSSFAFQSNQRILSSTSAKGSAARLTLTAPLLSPLLAASGGYRSAGSRLRTCSLNNTVWGLYSPRKRVLKAYSVSAASVAADGQGGKDTNSASLPPLLAVPRLAVQEPGALQASLRPAANWRKGANLEEKLQLLTQSWSIWIQQRLLKQWRDLEAARDGSIKNRFYRMAQGVLSREDPIESFLKVVPSDCTKVEIIHPSSLGAKLVRRRMRLLLNREYALHRRRLWGWSLLAAPLVPLLATPVPNIPLYFAGYKVYSARRALGGCSALRLMWAQTDTEALTKLRQQLAGLQKSGVVFAADSWPQRLLKEDTRYLDILANVEGRMRHVYHGHAPSQMVPTMISSTELDRLVQPKSRAESAIDDDAVLKIAKEFDAHGLFEHMARARKRSTGAMFPAHVA